MKINKCVKGTHRHTRQISGTASVNGIKI